MNSGVPSSSSLRRAARGRHLFYRQLFVVMAAQLLIMSLPWSFHRFATVGSGLMLLLLLTQLGRRQLAALSFGSTSTRFYRLLGVAGLAALLGWLFTSTQQRWSGLLLLLILASFVFWSLVRLLVLLRQEEQITGSVLAGAVAGYLMLGITGGLILSVLETLQPGSFVDLVSSHPDIVVRNHKITEMVSPQAWDLDFSRLNYFAFVSITTVGYGDIVPVRRLAQMACISLSIVGPLYIAIVMGLLISRYTVQTQQEEELEEELEEEQQRFLR
jgi:voltage-gated potassium channel